MNSLIVINTAMMNIIVKIEVNAPKKAYVLLTVESTRNLFKSVSGSFDGLDKAFLCSSVMSYIL